MLKIDPPDYQFCPFCRNSLETRIEEGKGRKFCPIDNWTYYPHVAGAAGAVIIRDNKVLLVQRNREPYKGLWMFPAGFIDYGEHPSETVLRETAEETGLKGLDPQLIGIFQVDDDPRSKGHFTVFFKVDTDEGEIVTAPEENQAIAWFEIDKLPTIGWKVHQQIAKLLQEGKI